MASFPSKKTGGNHLTKVSSMVADCQSPPSSSYQVIPAIRIRAAPKLSSSCMGSKRTGATVVLTWGFVNLVIYNFAMNGIASYNRRQYAYFAFIVIPISGLVADSFSGRYKFIKCCNCIMWLASLVLCVTYLVTYLNQTGSKITEHVRIGAFFLLHVGMGCSQVNMVQFSMDQLQDASSAHIITYIKWYVWSYFASVCTATFIQLCTCIQYLTVASLLPFGLLSYVLCSDFIFNKAIIKEPVLQNPLKLIYKVLKFSAINRYPKLRNSYTYWNRSRIDLAKTVFGGPFANEEVEDVKTFFRICTIFVFAAIIITATMSTEILISELYKTISICSDFTSCMSKQLVLKSGYYFILVCIPACELLILPFVRKKLPYLKILIRMVVGGACCLLSLLIVLALALSNQLCNKYYTNTTNVSQIKIEMEKPLYWYIGPSVLNCIGIYLGMVTGTEFICAQCPYTMKGLIYGVLYFFLGTGFTLIYYLDLIKIKTFTIYHNIILKDISLSLLINTSIVLLFGIISIIGVCCYKSRKREDTI